MTSSDHEDEDESIQVYLGLSLTHIQKTVLILAQALNNMTYHRRFNASSVIMAQTEAKSILKEKADIWVKRISYEPRTFETKLGKILKPRSICIMQCKERRKVLRLNHKLQRHPKCLFRRALHVNKDAEVVVEGAELPTNLFIEKKGDRLNLKEKVSVITGPFLNSLEFPVLIPDSDLQNVHPFIKKSIPRNKNT